MRFSGMAGRSFLTGSLLTMTVAAGGAGADPLQSSSSAVIVNSGSTNTAGFRIVVDRSGNAQYTQSARRSQPEMDKTAGKPRSRKLSEKLVRRLYSDLDKAGPLSALPTERCFKSVSFGTRMTIEFGAEETPDLSCPNQADSRAQNLQRDANEIVKLFREN